MMIIDIWGGKTVFHFGTEDLSHFTHSVGSLAECHRLPGSRGYFLEDVGATRWEDHD